MRVLDLFCGAGGAGMGYHQAGFEVVGVDHKDQPNYPFPIWKGDAVTFLKRCGGEFDFIHASPPCQGYSLSITTDGRWSHGIHQGINEPKLIEPVRDLLLDFGKPYVIENVQGARQHLINPITLCGAALGLTISRHRLFETNFPLQEPKHIKCRGLKHSAAEAWIAIDPKTRNRKVYSVVGKGRQTGSVQVWQELMQMPWATHDYELAGAIPPAYTKYIGENFKEYIEDFLQGYQ